MSSAESGATAGATPQEEVPQAETPTAADSNGNAGADANAAADGGNATASPTSGAAATPATDSSADAAATNTSGKSVTFNTAKSDAAAGAASASATSATPPAAVPLLSITDEMHTEFKERFEQFDTDHDGKLSTFEVDLLLRSIGHKLPKKKLIAMVKEVDADGLGSCTFMDFFVLIGTYFMTLNQHQQLVDAFATFDSEGTGMFSKDQLRSIMMGFGDKCSAEETDAIIKLAKKSPEGMIDYRAFAYSLVDSIHKKQKKKSRKKKSKK